MARKAIGIDLGGTDIKAGVVDDSGKILSRTKIATEAARGRTAIIRNIAEAADMARREAGLSWRQVAAVGLGSPGVFVPPRDLVYMCPNLKSLEGRELRQPVARLLPLAPKKVTLDNDANMAAFGEMWVGAGRGVKSLVLMTLGTGIGGGIVLNGEIWRGAWGMAAELGHQNLFPDGVRCECGNVGCLEAYASAIGLVRRFHEAVAAGRRTRLSAKIKSGAQISARDIALAARAGDRTCKRLIAETGEYLGIAATNMLHILTVELVIFAGGMTAAGAILLKPIRDTVHRRAFHLARSKARVLFSRLKNDAGLIGAAGYGLSRTRTSRKQRNAQ